MLTQIMRNAQLVAMNRRHDSVGELNKWVMARRQETEPGIQKVKLRNNPLKTK